MAETALAIEPAMSSGMLDASRLDAWLRERMPDLGGSIRIEQAAGGMSNPTFFVSYADRHMVLRKQPAVMLAPSAHRIDREYRVLSALAGSEVPVPSPILFCEDVSVAGTPFYLMDRLEGQVFANSSLPGITPAQRNACYTAMCTTLASMHRFDWAAASLGDFGKPGNYFERQIAVWAKQWDQFGINDSPDVDMLLNYVRDHVPSSGAAAICHGDYRVANLMFAPERGSVTGVFDWELATIGHPLADLAFNLQAWFLTPEQNGGILGLDLDALGIPSARDYVALYRGLAPDSGPLTAFHIAFAMFRAAVGLAGVSRRYETAPQPDFPASREARAFSAAYARAGITAIDSWDSI